MTQHHTTSLPPELVREALRLLTTGRAADRAAAAQLLAHGWDVDEAQRQTGIAPADQPDGYDELEE